MTVRPDRESSLLPGETCAFVALGANLPSRHGPPLATLQAALKVLCDGPVRLLALSRWYETAPWPDLDQPWYVNGVAKVATSLGPEALLARLHEIEADFGRVRRERWEARIVDLDLIDYGGRVSTEHVPYLPHPRMAERAFVLLPLADVAPAWTHPVTGRVVVDLIAALPPGQDARVLQD